IRSERCGGLYPVERAAAQAGREPERAVQVAAARSLPQRPRTNPRPFICWNLATPETFAPSQRFREELAMTVPKNTVCIWYDKDAEEAARFYAETFPDSAVTAIRRAPSDYPSGKAGDVLVVEFTVAGIPCIGLNGGPVFQHSEAFSFQIATEDQAETDRYWDAIVGNGGQESACGWCKDKWGISWQITPRALTEALAVGGDEAKRAFEAMMQMTRIDVAGIEAARCSEERRVGQE